MIKEKFQAFLRMNITSKLNAVSLVIFCMIAIDCSLTGSGHWLKAGPLSFRVLLCVLAVAAAVPSFIRCIRQWIKDPMLLSLLLFVIYIGICAIRGFIIGNSTDLLLSDIKGFAWLILVPIAAAVVNRPERLIMLMRCLAFAAAAQAVMIVFFNAVFVADGSVYDIFYRNWMEIKFATVDQISPTTYRFFFNSSPYLAIGILCMTYFQLRTTRFSFVYVAGMSICLMALILTFTRSLYGAVFVSLVLAIIFGIICFPSKRKRLAVHIAAGLFVVILLIVIQQYVLGCNSVQFALARTFNTSIMQNSRNDKVIVEIYDEDTQSFEEAGETSLNDVQQNSHIENTQNSDQAEDTSLNELQHYYIKSTQNSDAVRDATLHELYEMIRLNPVFGNGLGAAIESRQGGLVEYFYHDLINKTGFFGLLLYYFPIVSMVYMLVRSRKSRDIEQKLLNTIWIVSILVFISATYFNPYMNSSLGICCYSIAVACFRLKYT